MKTNLSCGRCRSPFWPVFVFGLLGIFLLSCLTGGAVEVLPSSDPWRDARAYRVPYPAGHPTVPRIFALADTGSMWPALRAGDVAVIQVGEPIPGDACAFLYRPTAAERAAGATQGYRLHWFVGKAGGRYVFEAIRTVGRPYPWRESCAPSDYVGVVRKVWRLRQ